MRKTADLSKEKGVSCHVHGMLSFFIFLNLGESTPFIEFMLEMMLESIDRIGNEVGNRVGNLTEHQMMIVDMMKKNTKVSAKMLSESIRISARKIEENISKLKKLEVIDRVGGTRGHWEVK